MKHAYTVRISTTRYFGAVRHPTFAAACDAALSANLRSSGLVVRDVTGRRWSVREIQDLRAKEGGK